MKPRNTNNEASALTIMPYTRLVALPIRAEHIFHFPEGLPAFEDFKDYVFAFKPDISPYIFMHAVEPPGLTFVCIDPFLVCPDFLPRIGVADQEFLHIERPEEVLVLSIVTVRPDVRETTANLLGPLAINIRTSIGKQIMCEGQSYPVRFRIWDALETLQKEAKTEPDAPIKYGGPRKPHAGRDAVHGLRPFQRNVTMGASFAGFTQG